jgi:hypothetical protein
MVTIIIRLKISEELPEMLKVTKPSTESMNKETSNLISSHIPRDQEARIRSNCRLSPRFMIAYTSRRMPAEPRAIQVQPTAESICCSK